jgi:RNA polymerase sigma-70 factor (ECF subfamily)
LGRLSDDEVLAGYFAAGNAKERAAFTEELFRRHHRRVVAWCLRFTGDREEAHDLAQAVLAKAYRHLGSFRGHSSIATWLYAITRSECMTFLRTRRHRAARVEADLAEVLEEQGPGPHEALEREASARWVNAILDRVLDETEKRVFTLHFGDDVPLDVITRLLGLSNRSGAKAYIVSARRKLARALRSYQPHDLALDA